MSNWIIEKLRSVVGLEPEVSIHSPDTEVVLETLSDSPRVFFVENFFTEEEADEIIRNVFDEEQGVNELARSTVGYRPGGAKKPRHSDVRTSDNAFDSNSEIAVRVKNR